MHIKGLTKLGRLHLEKTPIDDAGIENLAGLVNLEYLNLYGTKITDKALDHLAGLKKLRQLYVWQTVFKSVDRQTEVRIQFSTMSQTST